MPLACDSLVTMPLAVDTSHGLYGPLPPRVQAALNPLHKLMRTRLGAIVFVLIAFFVGALPIIGISPVAFFLQWTGIASHWTIRRFIDVCVANWMAFMTFVYENLLGIKIRTFGHSDTFKRRSLFIMNHVSHFDWMYFWSVVDRQGDLSYWKPVTKRSLRDLPILGQSMQMSNFVFVYRKWHLDKPEFRNRLYYLNAIKYPVQFLIFPEGGDFTPKTKRLSDQYAIENNLPRYSYCFHPRTTGFKYVMNALRDGGLDAVYDVTITFPDILPKTEFDIAKGIMPREVHFHIRKYNDKDIPEDQVKLKQWLKDIWKEKEVELEYFYHNRMFREKTRKYDYCHSNGNSHLCNGNIQHQKSVEVLRPRNVPFLLYSMFIFFFTNILILVPYFYVPYFGFYLLFGCFFLIFGGRKGLGNIFMSFKRKEIEEAVKQSKYNRD